MLNVYLRKIKCCRSFGEKYSRMDQVKVCGRIKFCGRQPLKKFTSSIFDYFAPFNSSPTIVFIFFLFFEKVWLVGTCIPIN